MKPVVRGRGVRASSRAKIGRARAFVRYLRDPAASVFGKLFLVAAVAYVILPVDLIPDVPVVGWLDDMGVMTVALAWLGKVVARYRDPAEIEITVDPVEA